MSAMEQAKPTTENACRQLLASVDSIVLGTVVYAPILRLQSAKHFSQESPG